MSKNKTSWLTMIGAIIVILGVLAYLVDPTLNFWQIEASLDPFYEMYYLNAFGFLFQEGEDAYSWGDPYLVAGIIVIAGSIIAILTGIKGWKTFSVLAGIVVIVGLVYFIYVHINYNGILSQINGFIEMDNAVFGTDEATLITYTWRLGIGFYISTIGAIITLIAAVKMK